MRIVKSVACIGSLFGRMPGVNGLAAGGVLALAALSPVAYAVPLLSPASNLAVPTTTAGIYVNVVTGVSGITPASVPGWDINPWGSAAISFFSTAANASSYVAAAPNSATANLAVGMVVGAASAYTATGTSATTFGALPGQWALNSTNYFGFRFTGEDALVHYGYGTMIVGASATVRSIGQLWYESVAGAPITVVPEPSTTAMWLVASALGAVALRRRRQATH